jgi:hypothetical protein
MGFVARHHICRALRGPLALKFVNLVPHHIFLHYVSHWIVLSHLIIYASNTPHSHGRTASASAL